MSNEKRGEVWIGLVAAIGLDDQGVGKELDIRRLLRSA